MMKCGPQLTLFSFDVSLITENINYCGVDRWCFARRGTKLSCA